MGNRDGCEGCLMDALSYEVCTFDSVNKEGVRCPCQSCLVKPMCRTSCDMFNDFNGNTEALLKYYEIIKAETK